MFYMKGDDMEEMFRKAADGYELNEDMAADWNKVHAALQDEGTAILDTKKEKKRRRYFFVWIFLAVGLLSLLTYKTAFYFSGKQQNLKPETTANQNSSVSNDLKANQTSPKQLESKSAIALKNASSKETSDKKNLSSKNNFSVTGTQAISKINDNVNDGKESNLANSANVVEANNERINPEPTPGNYQPEIKNTSNRYSPDSIKSNNNSADTKAVVGLVNKTNASQQNNLQQKSKTDNYTRQSFAYASVTANADISFVKFQKTSAPGYGLGVMGGYHFKNGISLETGLLYDKKNYYTKGEYFDTKDLPYLQYVNLISANGNCNMWEIPVNIKYDFNSQKKHNFFVAAGVSSYLMHKEYYNFKYEKNGVAGEKGYDYYHSSQNWFSVLNIGGGINIKAGNRYFLQIQPYYKIPISGVGKGNLSLSSAGINLSVTKRFK